MRTPAAPHRKSHPSRARRYAGQHVSQKASRFPLLLGPPSRLQSTCVESPLPVLRAQVDPRAASFPGHKGKTLIHSGGAVSPLITGINTQKLLRSRTHFWGWPWEVCLYTEVRLPHGSSFQMVLPRVSRRLSHEGPPGKAEHGVLPQTALLRQL